ncbi:hypothetical protein PCASD_04344 [Puccinia coronata f. sp. avenae]|uniref:Uncharacterized protein n=1 Tax=Puccinia coronata f. sp. avenae TaxID=200324 RepID=A0A2N5VCS6_9BASI|nr:hypothetical protein PCASD_04344 [Puccinia coronata f. sp. avenae]
MHVDSDSEADDSKYGQVFRAIEKVRAYDTVGETISAVRMLALKPPLPHPRHDRHLQKLKEFRTSHILWDTKDAILE